MTAPYPKPPQTIPISFISESSFLCRGGRFSDMFRFAVATIIDLKGSRLPSGLYWKRGAGSSCLPGGAGEVFSSGAAFGTEVCSLVGGSVEGTAGTAIQQANKSTLRSRRQP